MLNKCLRSLDLFVPVAHKSTPFVQNEPGFNTLETSHKSPFVSCLASSLES